MRYTARGAVSLARLAQDANGDLLYRCNRPWSDGTTGMKLSPVERLEKLAAFVPLPRAHLVRSGGCLAPHSRLRAAIIPTPRQQGRDGADTKTGTPSWHWARLLGRVFDLDMATCPVVPPWLTAHHCCHHPGGCDDPHPAPLHAGLRSTSPCPARCRQEQCAFDAAHVA